MRRSRVLDLVGAAALFAVAGCGSALEGTACPTNYVQGAVGEGQQCDSGVPLLCIDGEWSAADECSCEGEQIRCSAIGFVGVSQAGRPRLDGGGRLRPPVA